MPDTHQEITTPQLPGKIFLVDKPLDFTSADIVRIFKKDLNLRKIGHSGTLDPRATGLLILCSDKMTKRINEFIEYDKEYEGVIRMGAVTKSFDTETEEVITAENFVLSDEEIEKARVSFLGETEQLPPMYSAIKNKGKPLYKLARKGKEIERKLRKISISNFVLRKKSENELYFRLSCSKGTYIRVIAYDLGEKLKVGGYLKELRRTRVGKFMMEGLDQEIRSIRYKTFEE
ncbi:MAG: tRNA pseudouridine(55) synthase TruB [bacterium]|nr:tRNA pseudouridine(55) synthase TruB [bacterium]